MKYTLFLLTILLLDCIPAHAQWWEDLGFASPEQAMQFKQGQNQPMPALPPENEDPVNLNDPEESGGGLEGALIGTVATDLCPTTNSAIYAACVSSLIGAGSDD